jgi:uncharacterized membrane protein required for colicin V production
MFKNDKLKGVLLVISGVIWIIFVYNFDALIDKPKAFGTKAVLGFILGIIAVINGIRIYRRR